MSISGLQAPFFSVIIIYLRRAYILWIGRPRKYRCSRCGPVDMEQSANSFEGPVADSWTILQPAKDRNVHSQLH